MDLADALEQLSLQVKSDRKELEDSTEHLQQLQLFDSSIATLFSQLNAREYPELTVRKISHILALGKQIEAVYKQHFMNKQFVDQTAVDITGLRRLCDTFICLCWDEPCVADLPTVMRYNEYYNHIMIQISEITSSSQTSTASRQSSASERHEISSGSDGIDLNQSSSINNTVNDDAPMCLEEARDAFDCVLLQCDREQLGEQNWTNNRLYINNPHN